MQNETPSIKFDPETQAAHEIYTKLVFAFFEAWKADRQRWMDEGGTDHIKYGKQSVIALAHVASVMAVDSLMDEETFVNVCRASFQNAYRTAPKFK